MRDLAPRLANRPIAREYPHAMLLEQPA